MLNPNKHYKPGQLFTTAKHNICRIKYVSNKKVCGVKKQLIFYVGVIPYRANIKKFYVESKQKI